MKQSHDAPDASQPLAAASKWGYFMLGLLTALIVFASGVAALWVYDSWNGQHPVVALPALPRPTAVDEALLDEAWQIIRTDFYGPIPSEQKRTHGAIKGSVETLNDPYTFFIEPKPAVREQEQLQGAFGGIGAYLSVDEAGRIVLTPMIDRPAAQAGVQDGDILLAVDGQPLATPADVDAVTDMLRGEVGSIVTLTVRRGEKQLSIRVKRARIELPTVSWRALADAPEVGYIRIEHFSGLTDQEFIQALNALMQQHADQAYVIDLRGNPGGLVDAAVEVADHFLDGGVVLIEKHADGSQKRYKAQMGVDVPAQTPVLLLVDGNSASAAEILAGAMQDRHRGTLIGEKTYGKGSIQRIHRLSDGSALHVTFAKWFTPDDRAIDGVGLTPDVPVTPSPDHDSFITKALEVLGKSSKQ